MIAKMHKFDLLNQLSEQKTPIENSQSGFYH